MKSLSDLKGVGPKLRSLFEAAGISKPEDLLFYLPRKYEDRRHSLTFEELEENLGKNIASEGIIERYIPRFGTGRKWLEAVVRVPARMESAAYINFIWFHSFGNSIQKGYPGGSKVFFTGKIQKYQSRLQIAHPELAKDSGQRLGFGSLIPVYPQIGTLTSRRIRDIILQTLDDMADGLDDPVPPTMRKKFALAPLNEAFKELHRPRSWNPLEAHATENPYVRRLIFDEFFFFSLALEKIKQKTSAKSAASPKISWSDKLQFPFSLTGDQKKVLGEIQKDLLSGGVMHRLVQGDVGSGKTIVAFAALIQVVQSGFQAAMLAPTQLLAEQHSQNFKKFYPEFAEVAILLTGALTEKIKKDLRKKIAQGEVKFVFGTQAVLSGLVNFENLGLVVIDEQHRFGVEQRRELATQTQSPPHLLVMTATPIPRSLALTLYGDLELSTIKEKPRGRLPIKTYLLRKSSEEKLTERVNELLAQGRQIYCVYPLVETSELLEDVENVIEAHAYWKQHLAPFSVGLLHGKLKPSEKELVMEKFRKGELNVLVSTTVIEVGVDVPNASVMIIENAERFGLTQLHQLRGRVGRGSQESICALVVPNNLTPEAEARLQVILGSEDGFKIAEQDLLQRGPGDFLGLRQSGSSGFKTAHLIRDLSTLEIAKAAAKEIFQVDPSLALPEHRALKQVLANADEASLERVRSG